MTKKGRNICSLCSPLLSKQEGTLDKAWEEGDLKVGWEVHMLGLVEEDQKVAWKVQKLVLKEGDQEGASHEGASHEEASHEGAKRVQVPSDVVGF